MNENEIHQREDGTKEERKGKKKTKDGNMRDSLLLGQEKEEKEDGRRLQRRLQSAV